MNETQRATRLAWAGVIIGVVGVVATLLSIDALKFGENAATVLDFTVKAAPTIVLIALTVQVWDLTRRTSRGGLARNVATAQAAVLASENRREERLAGAWDEAMKGAKTVRAIGIGHNRFISEAGAEFYRSLLVDRRGQLQLLFPNPDGAAIKAREIDEGLTPGALSAQVRLHLQDIGRYLAPLPGTSQRIEVRLYDFAPVINLAIFDDTIAFVSYYGVRVKGAESPSFAIPAGVQGVFSFYRKEMDLLWQQGSPCPGELIHPASPRTASA